MARLFHPYPLTSIDITIIVNQTDAWTCDDYDSGLLNGSEEMVIEFARALAKDGSRVTVYSSCDGKRYTDFKDGAVVDYYDRKYLNSHEMHGTLIAFKDQESLLLDGFDKRFLWTADAHTLTKQQRLICNGMFALGPWHEQELKSMNIGFRDIHYIEPGVDKQDTKPVDRIPKQCLYASSPDRGLDFLESIWPDVLKAHPDATLIRTYSKFKRRTNPEMMELYKQSDVLAYPCLGAERYCITAIKAQMYGTIPCVIPHMALQDTVQFGKKVLKSKYLHTIIELLDNAETREAIRKDMMASVKYNTWEDVVDKWRQIIG